MGEGVGRQLATVLGAALVVVAVLAAVVVSLGYVVLRNVDAAIGDGPLLSEPTEDVCDGEGRCLHPDEDVCRVTFLGHQVRAAYGLPWRPLEQVYGEPACVPGDEVVLDWSGTAPTP